MPKIDFATRLGEISLWGDPDRLGSDRPAVLALPGVFARIDGFWFQLQEKLPEADVFATQLPGHRSPPLAETSVAAFAEAFDEVIQGQLSGRPLLVCGESIGGTVVLALASPGPRRLAIDPPLRTAGLWPLRARFAQIYRDVPERRAFLESIFAFDGQRFGDIDYIPLIKHPARVLIGDLPLLPERASSVAPGLLGEAERDWLRRSPLIHATTVQGAGHIMTKFEAGLVEMVRAELAKTIASFQA
jgi:pimeloyl-ACP methyl ester carboxylesterase